MTEPHANQWEKEGMVEEGHDCTWMAVEMVRCSVALKVWN